MKRFFNAWQGWLASLLALALFLASPFIIRAYDPTAGVWDGGVLQWLLLAVVAAALGVGLMWTLWQIAFPSTDKEADQKIDDWFNAMTSAQKYWAVQGTFLFMLIYWVAILFAIPR
jgi:magnesium-transporting ATPase (P-type)